MDLLFLVFLRLCHRLFQRSSVQMRPNKHQRLRLQLHSTMLSLRKLVVMQIGPPPPSHNPAAPQQHTLSTEITDQFRLNFHLNHPTHPIVDEHSSVDNPSFWGWTARVEFNKYELGTSFSFLGLVPENPQEWRVSSNFVGGHHAFVNLSSIVPPAVAPTVVTSKISLWKDLYILTMVLPSIRDWHLWNPMSLNHILLIICIGECRRFLFCSLLYLQMCPGHY